MSRVLNLLAKYQFLALFHGWIWPRWLHELYPPTAARCSVWKHTIFSFVQRHVADCGIKKESKTQQWQRCFGLVWCLCTSSVRAIFIGLSFNGNLASFLNLRDAKFPMKVLQRRPEEGALRPGHVLFWDAQGGPVIDQNWGQHPAKWWLCSSTIKHEGLNDSILHIYVYTHIHKGAYLHACTFS